MLLREEKIEHLDYELRHFLYIQVLIVGFAAPPFSPSIHPNYQSTTWLFLGGLEKAIQ